MTRVVVAGQVDGLFADGCRYHGIHFAFHSVADGVDNVPKRRVAGQRLIFLVVPLAGMDDVVVDQFDDAGLAPGLFGTGDDP